MDLKTEAYQIVSKVPKGKVITYGAIAKAIGLGSARPIGNWLHKNPSWPQVPCHRVVNSQGKLALNYGAKGKINTHAKRLILEGVQVVNNRVDLEKYLWKVK